MNPNPIERPRRGVVDSSVYVIHRTSYLLLVWLTSIGAMFLLHAAYASGGLTPLKLLLLVLYAILTLWIAGSFWAATLGFFVLLGRFDFFARRRRAIVANASSPLPADARTAILMPIYSEDPDRVFAGVRAIWRSLEKTGKAETFDFFILSDTRDVDTWIREETEWYRLCNETGAHGRIFYRNRKDNTARKSGNIADFVERWGANYRYMIVLDADSIMAGDTLVKMVRLMEANPDTALIQAPPLPVNRETLFARILQFASTAYGPLFTAGASFWQLGDSNFWGHNAIIRIAPFAAHCGLPKLPGREPFGGEILSHDFVEAALLRRAGWRVWLAYELRGSYEELPPTLIDFAKRDRRWCQGNLQHFRLIGARGWHPVSRLHFAMGVMSYLSSPLWMIFLLVTGLEAYYQTQAIPDYFFRNHFGPVWPVSFTVEMKVVLMFTLAMLFLPKVMALILILIDPAQRRAFGGIFHATAERFAGNPVLHPGSAGPDAVPDQVRVGDPVAPDDRLAQPAARRSQHQPAGGGVHARGANTDGRRRGCHRLPVHRRLFLVVRACDQRCTPFHPAVDAVQ
ncbi:MAG: glucans biosynthesis glucosyltransferase MdoH [Halioglobus sp.]